MSQGKKVSDELVDGWLASLPNLQGQFPAKNRGFPDSYNQAYKVLADRHNLHPTTVYKRLKGALKEKKARGGYASKHEHLRYHIAEVLAEVYNSDFEISMPEIITRITENSGIKIRESSLETMLKKHNNNPEGKPLIESETGKYVLNGNFYASQKKHLKYWKKALNSIQA